MRLSTHKDQSGNTLFHCNVYSCDIYATLLSRGKEIRGKGVWPAVAHRAEFLYPTAIQLTQELGELDISSSGLLKVLSI